MSDNPLRNDSEPPNDLPLRCARFQAAWASWKERSGADAPRPDIASFLRGLTGDARHRLLIELIRRDAAHRRELGEAPTMQDYTAQFPADLPAVEAALLLSDPHDPDIEMTCDYLVLEQDEPIPASTLISTGSTRKRAASSPGA